MKLLQVLRGSLVALAIAAGACHAGGKKPGDEPEHPVVPVSKPVQRSVVDYSDHRGRAAARVVTIQPRVTGFLTKIAFKEGSLVKQGDVLFEIDPRPYQAQLAVGQAKVTLAEASLKLARATHRRLKDLASKAPDAVSPQDLDQAQGREEEAVATLELAKANLQLHKLDLDWTVVRAPVAGRIGRSEMAVGNIVMADATKLTTIVATDPMYVDFHIDERTFLTIRLARAKDGGNANAKLEQVMMGLSNEEGFPHAGTIDFVDNRVDASSGDLLARAVFANPPANAAGLQIWPGMAVRVRIQLGPPHEALLVTDRAVLSDKGSKHVYVVDAQNKVESRLVTVGQLQPDGLRVITQGLKKDDAVIVGSFKLVRPGSKVQPEQIAMPVVK